jgi:hypothetical protein
VSVSKTTLAFLSPGYHEDRTAAHAVPAAEMRWCSRRNACMSLIAGDVGAQHSGNHAVNTFSSCRAGLEAVDDPCALHLGALEWC